MQHQQNINVFTLSTRIECFVNIRARAPQVCTHRPENRYRTNVSRIWGIVVNDALAVFNLLSSNLISPFDYITYSSVSDTHSQFTHNTIINKLMCKQITLMWIMMMMMNNRKHTRCSNNFILCTSIYSTCYFILICLHTKKKHQTITSHIEIVY